MTHYPEYRVWAGIKTRCYDKNYKEYRYYGGRGIKVCLNWKTGPLAFPNFYKDIGPRPSSKHSIDRIDNDGNYSCGYCPECIENNWLMNCRWTSKMDQSNNRRSNVYLEHKGENLTVTQWAAKLNLNKDAILYRLNKGWSICDILETPTKKYNYRDSLEYLGEYYSIKELSIKYGISVQNIRQRLVRGWSLDRILNSPIEKN